jgi:hypothetical protein
MEAAANIVDPSNSASPVFVQYYIPRRPLSEFVGVFSVLQYLPARPAF